MFDIEPHEHTRKKDIRVLVCGGRDYTDYKTVRETLERIHREHTIAVLVHGGARGADGLAAHWASLYPRIVIECHRADWGGRGKKAGPERNKRMLETNPDMVVAFPGGNGTAHMVSISRAAGKRVIHVGV